ncbi:MAG: hypothetical protein M3370_04075 [Actinomycetota bacterium]|nr:hypothetical protein [Actinomycetota bacterium]
MFLHAWLIYPVVLALLACGCGLLVRRVAGVALPPALVLPVGFAVLVVVATVLTFLDATAELAAPAMAALALGGLVIGPRGSAPARLRPRRAWIWPAVAALLPALAIALPVLLTGQPGFTGYTRIVDLAFQLDLAQHFVTDGRSVPQSPRSSYDAVIARVVAAGYPAGAPAVLGATAHLAALDPIWAWQGFLAFTGAMLGLSLWALLGGAIAWAPGRAVAAGVAAQPTILYAYGITGGIKELAAAAMVALCAALLVSLRAHERMSAGALVPLLLAVVAGLAVFTLGIVPWLAVLVLVAFGPRLMRARRLPRPSVRASAALVAALVVVAVPLGVAGLEVAPLLRAGGPEDLGNLAAPVPAWAAIGPWLTPDHRFPLEAAGTETATALLAAAVLLLALLGFARGLGRRDVGLVGIGVAGAVGLAVVLWRGSAWVELKAITTTAPLCAALAFAGAATLAHGRRMRPLALGAGVVVAVAILAGNALVYNGTSLAPYERFAELQDIAEDYKGQGPTLHPVFEEHAEYLLREMDAVALTNPLGSEDTLRPQAPPRIVFQRDLDQYTLEGLSPWQLIVTRRDPTASRPPSDFALVKRTDHYEVWQRREDAPEVVFHQPFGPLFAERDAAVCDTLEDRLREAGPQARLAYAPAPRARRFRVVERSPLWLDAGEGQWLSRGPGFIRYEVRVPQTGRYTLWLSGSFGRLVTVSVDGREVGRLRWQGNYPRQFEPVDTVALEAGQHVVEVRRSGGSLLPGMGNELAMEGTTTRVGALVLAPPDALRPVRTVSPQEAGEACASDEPWDWAEVVAPPAA